MGEVGREWARELRPQFQCSACSANASFELAREGEKQPKTSHFAARLSLHALDTCCCSRRARPVGARVFVHARDLHSLHSSCCFSESLTDDAES